MRRRLGVWNTIWTEKSDMGVILLMLYSVPIVKPWRVVLIKRFGHNHGAYIGVFSNCYFTEAKARRALADKYRHFIVLAALDALGIVP